MNIDHRALPVSSRDLDQVTSVLRLLSDKTRVSILMLLAEGEMNVTSLCRALELPQPTVSHHLGLLRMSNLIANRRQGKQVFYGLDGRITADGPATVSIHLENMVLTLAGSPTPEGARVRTNRSGTARRLDAVN